MQIENRNLRLTVESGGISVRIDDNTRNMAWQLDPATLAFRLRHDSPRVPLTAGILRKDGQSIIAEHGIPGGAATLAWTLADDYIEVTASITGDDIHCISLPGSFHPCEGAHTAFFPTYQGVLYKGTPHLWEESRGAGGHSLWSMSMGALLGARGGLLVIQESATGLDRLARPARAGAFFPL
jgi:hypothetical protein